MTNSNFFFNMQVFDGSQKQQQNNKNNNKKYGANFETQIFPRYRSPGQMEIHNI